MYIYIYIYIYIYVYRHTYIYTFTDIGGSRRGAKWGGFWWSPRVIAKPLCC